MAFLVIGGAANPSWATASLGHCLNHCYYRVHLHLSIGGYSIIPASFQIAMVRHPVTLTVRQPAHFPVRLQYDLTAIPRARTSVRCGF